MRTKFKVTTWVQHPIDLHSFGSMSIHPPIPMVEFFFQIWDIMGEIKVNMGPKFSRLTFLSSHVNRASHSWVMTFPNLTLKIKSQCHGWGHISKSQCGSNIISIHNHFIPFQSALTFLRFSSFKIWLRKSTVKVKWPWCYTTTGLNKPIELQMV